jgi:hypothetical protein
MKQFIDSLFKSLNPDAYRHLVGKSNTEALKFFFSALFMSFILMLFISLPTIASMPSDITARLNDFYQLEWDLKLDTKILVEYPPIAADTTGTVNLSNSTAKVVITDTALYMKEGLCLWAKPLCFHNEYTEYKYAEYSDILSKSSEYSLMFTVLFLLALPTILFIIYVLFAIKYLIIAFVAWQLIFVIMQVVKQGVMYRSLFKMALYATTVLMLLEITFAPFFNIGYWPLILYFIIATAGSYLTGGFAIVHETRK